jgi:hypothetical protein
MEGYSGKAGLFAPSALRVQWRLGDGSALQLLANLSSQEARLPWPEKAVGATIFDTMPEASTPDSLPPWGVRWTLHTPAPGCSGEAVLQEADFKEAHEQFA